MAVTRQSLAEALAAGFRAPRERGRGVGARLVNRQHDDADDRALRHVEIRALDCEQICIADLVGDAQVADGEQRLAHA